MNDRNIEKRHHQTFENIKKTGNDSSGLWMGRQLGKILDYAEYRTFLPVIEKSKKACANSEQPVENHFVEMHEMVAIGSEAERKGMKKSQQILDNIGSTELAANLFRATQIEEKLRRENIQGKTKANKTHFEVGKKVRQTIEELGGTMPKDLQIPVENMRKLEKRAKTQKKLGG